MKNSKWILLVVAALMSGSAFAGANFGISGNANYGLGDNGALGYGGGIVIDFPSGMNSLQIAPQYTVYKSTVTVLGISVTGSAGYVHVPLTYELGLSHSVSLGLGGYYDAPLASGNSSDYGLVGGLRFGGHRGLFLEVSYDMGLKDNGGSKAKDLFVLVGLMFGK